MPTCGQPSPAFEFIHCGRSTGHPGHHLATVNHKNGKLASHTWPNKEQTTAVQTPDFAESGPDPDEPEKRASSIEAL